MTKRRTHLAQFIDVSVRLAVWIEFIDCHTVVRIAWDYLRWKEVIDALGLLYREKTNSVKAKNAYKLYQTPSFSESYTKQLHLYFFAT